MEKFTLDSQERKPASKSEMKKLRASGKIPAILYGDMANMSLTIDAVKFTTLLKMAGRNVMISLRMPDKTSKTVLIKDIQKNVISRELSHIDFYSVSMKKKIDISIPVVLVGEAPGVKSGGVLSHIVRELKVKCLPADIPEKITVDISALEIGNTVLVKDLVVPKNVEIIVAPEQIVANIVSPTILEEVVPAVTEAIAEPEVIGKGKKEEVEEGAEAAPAAAPSAVGRPAAKKEDATLKPKEEKK